MWHPGVLTRATNRTSRAHRALDTATWDVPDSVRSLHPCAVRLDRTGFGAPDQAAGLFGPTQPSVAPRTRHTHNADECESRTARLPAWAEVAGVTPRVDPVHSGCSRPGRRVIWLAHRDLTVTSVGP